MATMNARQRAANNLLGTLGLTSPSIDPRGFTTPSGRVMNPLGAFASPQQGGMQFRRGVMPSQTELNQYLDGAVGPLQRPSFPRQPVGPVVRNPIPGGAARLTDKQRAVQATPPEPTLFEKLVASYQSKIDEANAANLKRYDEIHGELSDVRTRNQDRVKNWGTAAQQDIDDRMKKALGDQRAYLASVGLTDASILPAFTGDVAQRTAREQQRVSEMRDSRASEYDTRDTNALVGAVERRDDVAPDYNQLLSLAMQYGQSGQGKGYAALQDEIAGLKRQVNTNRRYRPQTQLPLMPGPIGAAPVFLNAGSFFGFNGTSRPATTNAQAKHAADAAAIEQWIADNQPDDSGWGLTPVQRRVMRERQAKAKRVEGRRADGYATPSRTGHAFVDAPGGVTYRGTRYTFDEAEQINAFRRERGLPQIQFDINPFN